MKAEEKFMKVTELTEQIREEEGIIIENPINMRYLTGLGVESGILFLAKEKQMLLIDERYWLDFKNVREIEVIKLINFSSQIRELAKKMGLKKIYLEPGYVTINGYKRYKEIFKRLSEIEVMTEGKIEEIVNKMRKNKSKEEIEKIMIGQKITDKVFKNILGYIRDGIREKEIAKRIKEEIEKLGGEGESFETIVVSGPRTAIAHGRPTDKKIKIGELVTIDFGVIFQGYHTDMTRTLAIGEINDQIKEVYKVVLEAQEKAIEAIKPGLRAKELDKIAREYIDKKGYGEYFVHSLGHGVGLEIHERPYISTKSKDVIEEGDIITIEPGIYIPDRFGVRIEDLILVTDRSFINLTESEKSLIKI